MCYATPAQPKIGSDKIIQLYTHSTWFLKPSENDFRGLYRHNLKSLQRYYCTLHSRNLTFTTLVKFDFRILHLHNLKSLSTIWLYTTLAQPGFHVLHNLISGFYSYTTWNLYLYGKVTYFTLHSHTLIFITFAKNDFCSFFILVVCMFSYI